MSNQYASLLLKFLEEYITLCEVWEEHWSKVTDKGFASKQEELNAYRGIQDTVQRDLVLLCKQNEVTFRDLFEIIPPAFKTTAAERLEILEDLREYVKVKYGE